MVFVVQAVRELGRSPSQPLGRQRTIEKQYFLPGIVCSPICPRVPIPVSQPFHILVVFDATFAQGAGEPRAPANRDDPFSWMPYQVAGR